MADDRRRAGSDHQRTVQESDRFSDGSERHGPDRSGSEMYEPELPDPDVYGPERHGSVLPEQETYGSERFDLAADGPAIHSSASRGSGIHDPASHGSEIQGAAVVTSGIGERDTTPPDAHGGERDPKARLAPAPPGTRRYLVLGVGSGEDDAVALDMASGVLLRLHSTQRPLPDGTIEPFDVVDATLSSAGPVDDLARPETVLVSGPLVRAGVLRGRRAAKRLRRLIAPPQPHLLGFPGSTWPYWEFHGDQPSVALVTPSRGPMLFRRSEDGTAWVRFGWYRTDNWLPVQDPVAQAVLAASRRQRLSGKQLAAALGFRPVYLVVAVSRPRDGYCSKGVLAILPAS